MKPLFLTGWLLTFSLVLSAQSMLPNAKYTPGVVRVTSAPTICHIKWGRDRRHVTAAMKKKVCSDYGVSAKDCTGQNFEIDHLIPRELGGADDVKNLWPQPWPEAKLKDRLENRLHQDVCAGVLPLKTAQKEISTDWYKNYISYYGQ